jgi:glycosyltransferase involved in cell wall biosynthesis
MKKINEGLSVILPAYNEEANIDNVLHTLVQVLNNSDIDFEVIVVDNGSTDNTIDIVRKHQVSIISCQIKGAAACRNLGVENSEFDKICFLDSDCLVNEDWAVNIQKAFYDTKVAAYGGPCLSPKDGTWVEKAWAPEVINTDTYEVSLLAGCNFSVRKDLFSDLGGFNEELLTAEDDDLSRRINHSEYKCISDTKQAVVHLGYPKTLKESFQKVLWHGTTQLKAHGLFGDKMVMLTFAWLFFILCSLLALGNDILFIVFTSIFLLILPALLVIKKLSYRTKSIYEILTNYTLVLVTLFARSVGLILELYSIAKNRLFLKREKG